ncbi:hypothetical protein NUW54_g10722 [Trametes sanguinea]|uniref:Uncharacterized protein n=1 Tax=Trametes sanguinea TaxID=158606 RepID=A0ACC1NUR3_9APHY|nr:hypothetical protein NUW54_g10722 [Trametes sanguinea]
MVHSPQLTLNHPAAIINNSGVVHTSPHGHQKGAAPSSLAQVPNLFADLIPTTAVKPSETAGNEDPRETQSVQGHASTPLSGMAKSVDQSRKASGKMAAVWLPALGAESLKDRCARVWARQPENLTKTQEDFNAWYKHAAHYKKKKLANQDGSVANALPPAAAKAPVADEVAGILGSGCADVVAGKQSVDVAGERVAAGTCGRAAVDGFGSSTGCSQNMAGFVV